MDYTTHFEKLLRAAGRSWSAVDLPRSTLQGCRAKNSYTTAQLEKIAEAIGKQPWEILRPDAQPITRTQQQLLAEIEVSLTKMLEAIRNTRL